MRDNIAQQRNVVLRAFETYEPTSTDVKNRLTADDKAVERLDHEIERLLAVLKQTIIRKHPTRSRNTNIAVGDELGNQGVVVHLDFAALLHTGVNAHRRVLNNNEK